jgi:hypothetical protein
LRRYKSKQIEYETYTPNLEIIIPSFGSSFSISKHEEKQISTQATGTSPRNWVYINGGSGKRQVGSHVSYYNDGDLILIVVIYLTAGLQMKRQEINSDTNEAWSSWKCFFWNFWNDKY